MSLMRTSTRCFLPVYTSMACMCTAPRQQMHASFQSSPCGLPLYFQWHGLIGYLEAPVGLRQGVGRLTLVDISTGCCVFHGPPRNVASAQDAASTSRLRGGMTNLWGQDREGDCRSWHFAICLSDATIHTSAALLKTDGIPHLNQRQTLASHFGTRLAFKVCNSVSVTTGN